MIADVSGKGVSAALLAALLQGAFVFASEGALQIDDVMSRVNRFLIERARGEKYATVVYCTIDRSGELRWSNAGHPKPILVRASGELQLLESTGMPIGMMDVASYEVKTIQLQPGDKLVLFSDGLSEAANADGEFFDKKRAEGNALCPRRRRLRRAARQAGGGGGRVQRSFRAGGRHHDAGAGVSAVATSAACVSEHVSGGGLIVRGSMKCVPLKVERKL